MPEIPSWIWSLAAAVLFLPTLTRVLTWFAARGIRLQQGSHRPASEADPAEWEGEVLHGADAVLGPLGFRFAGYGLHTEEIAGTPCSHHEAYHVHETGLSWAVVRPAHHPSPQCPFLIAWFTALEDGTLLHTRNLDPNLGDALVPWLKPADRYEVSWEAVEEFHRRRVAESAPIPPARGLTGEGLIALRDKACREAWEAGRESGRTRLIAEGPEGPEGLGRLSPAATWEATRVMNRFRPTLFKAYRDWLKQPREFPLSPRAEAECYRRIQRVQPEAGGWGKAFLVVASLGAASLLFGKDFTPAFAAAFLLVLLVHEMGHALTMRLVGYKDVNIFFIPFFGAMATGKPGKILHPWQEALVLLAGPVPGLLAGAWLVQSELAAEHPIAYQAGLLALGINALNLLPISPLDGGRILDLALFRRAPRLGLAFLVLGAAAFLAAGIAAPEAILGLVGASLLWGAGRAYRQARILADVRQECEAGQAPASDPAEDLFRRLRAAGGKPLAFVYKLPQVKAMLISLPTRAPGAWAAAGILALYVGAWIAPFGLMVIQYRAAGGREIAVAREALAPAEKALYDRICGDSAVVRLDAHRISRNGMRRIFFDATSISSDDTSRVRGLYDTTGDARIGLSVLGPAWRLGEIDSALLRGLQSPWDADSAFFALPQDTVDAREARYFARLDSLSALEDGIWRSWPPDRRQAALPALEAKARARGQSWNCWKDPGGPDSATAGALTRSAAP